MKIFLLIACVCAYVHSASVSNEILPPGISVSTSSHNNHVKLNLLSTNNAVTPDDQLLSSELQLLEAAQGRNLVADNIKNLLESFRETVINGNDDVPPLDPLVVSLLGPYDYTTTGKSQLRCVCGCMEDDIDEMLEFALEEVDASAAVNNLRMEGLMWYLVDHVTFSALRLSFGTHITIPWLTITGSYDAEARLVALLTHRAGGNFRIFVNRIEVGLDMRLGTNILGGGHLILRELDIVIDIHDTNIQIDGMTGSSLINTFISTFVQSVTQDVIQSEMANVSQLLSEELFDIINDTLKDFTINDILG